MNWTTAIMLVTIIAAIALHVTLVMYRRRLHNSLRPDAPSVPIARGDLDRLRLNASRPIQRYDPREDDTRIVPILPPTGPVFRDRKEIPMPMPPDFVPTTPAPPEYSVNDYHKSRAQDLAVAQLAAQLAQMDGSPWSVQEIRRDAPPESDYCISRALGDHPIQQLSSQLNLMSNIAAIAGTQTAITGIGTEFYVTMGNRRISCPSQAEQDRLVRDLNAGWWALVADIRAQVVADLHIVATNDGQRIQKDIGLARMWCVECAQTRIPCKSKDEAVTTQLKLTRAYLKRIAPILKGILTELAEVTAPTAKASLDLPITPEDRSLLPDPGV